jgi:hypothetical protein
MWVILGVIAIVVTFINLYMYKAGKDYKLTMAMGLSFTALTLCAEYSLVSVGRSGRLGSFNGCRTWYGNGIMVVDHCFYLTKYSTYTFRTKR